MEIFLAYILKPFLIALALCGLFVIRYLFARFMPDCKLKRLFLTRL